MTTPKSLAIAAAMFLGTTAVAFAQGAGIAPNSQNLPPQSAYGLNGYGSGYGYGYYGYGTPYYAPQYYGSYGSGLYDYAAPSEYAAPSYGYGYARSYWRWRY